MAQPCTALGAGAHTQCPALGTAVGAQDLADFQGLCEQIWQAQGCLSRASTHMGFRGSQISALLHLLPWWDHSLNHGVLLPSSLGLATRQPQGNNTRTICTPSCCQDPLPAALRETTDSSSPALTSLCRPQISCILKAHTTLSLTTTQTTGINPKKGHKDHKISLYIKKYHAKNFFLMAKALGHLRLHIQPSAVSTGI